VFHFHPSRENHQLGHRCCLFHVDAVVDRDARLQVRDIDESRTQIFAEAFELGGALCGGTCWPGFNAQEHKHDDRSHDERDKSESDWPGKSCLRRREFLHRAQITAKKVPPPTPDGREGRLFPPEQSWKTLRLVIELTAGGNKILHELMRGAIEFAKKMSIFLTDELDRGRAERSKGRWSLRKLAQRVLVLHAQSG
jgi:hypothetical protein